MAKTPRVVVQKDDLHRLVSDIFKAAGTNSVDAEIIADVLVWANLRGVDSHGVVRIPRYLELFESGEAKAAAAMQVKRLRPGAISVDADGAPGPVALVRAMREAISAARGSGIACANVRGTVHTGAIGYYAALAADAGMVGIGIVAGIPNMACHGGRTGGVATSPLAIAVPSATGPHVLLDMATAAIALGKINQHKIQGIPLPEGAALTKEGEPTTDASRAAIPLPMAGAKGAGMSLMFEFLSSVLAGSPIMASYHAKDKPDRRHRQNATMIAVDVDAFTDLSAFKSNVDATLAVLKDLPRAEGVDEIQYPGERGAKAYALRLKAGIPIPGVTWDALKKDAARVGVAVPAAA
jgi:LDH2 family malate/lactate/ureidoglycolate dehydrogenase